MITIPFSMYRTALKMLWDAWGIDYFYGAEIAPGDLPRAKFIDCSELSERIFKDGLNFNLVDGADNQYLFCKTVGKKITDSEKLTPFDLVFLWDKDAIGKHIGHVAIVFGEMLPVGGVFLIEARGKPWNHVMFTPLDKFKSQFGERVAGIFRLVEPESLRVPDKV